MYAKMLRFAKDYLENNDVEATKIGHFPFRKRSEHISRGQNDFLTMSLILIKRLF